ncbi:MAG TPA: alpha/beta hydrolase [Mucilaginibacter sp.]
MKHLFKTASVIGFLLIAPFMLLAQEPYPFPVSYLPLIIEGQQIKMAYMEVKPQQPNGQAVILFHGKNFNGYYWKDVAYFLQNKGYEVIIPDQVGWGKSDKPNIHYSFSLLAANNKALLDSLHIKNVIVIGHSMGGMLATRFTLMYTPMVNKLILEDPIGLEDYKTFIPYTSIDATYQKELAATYKSYKKYMQAYFPVWKPEYEELVKQQAVALKDPEFKKIAWANALTYDMIYEQPVCYEFGNITVKTLIIVGKADRTIVGKDKLPPSVQAMHGQYPELGENTHSLIQNSELKMIDDVGHIPHIQALPLFEQYVDRFLQQK